MATIKRSLRSRFLDAGRNKNQFGQKSYNSKGGNFSREPVDSKSRFSMQRLSPAQLKERRYKGLCCNYNEK